MDIYYEAAVCFLEIMEYIPTETIGLMFGFEEINKKISKNVCDVSAAINIKIFPFCGLSAFDIKDIISAALTLPSDTWLRLLIQQKTKYLSEIEMDMLLKLNDIEDKSYSYKMALYELYLAYSDKYQELVKVVFVLRENIY